MTEHFFDFALERAQYLDDYLKREKKVIGPLHGLPISLKDSYHVKGYHTTIGYVSFLEQGRATSNSAVVDMLLDLGAVLYVKTNVPQTMLVSSFPTILVHDLRRSRPPTPITISTDVLSTPTTRPSQLGALPAVKALFWPSGDPSLESEPTSQAQSASPRFAAVSTASSQRQPAFPTAAKSASCTRGPRPWNPVLDL